MPFDLLLMLFPGNTPWEYGTSRLLVKLGAPFVLSGQQQFENASRRKKSRAIGSTGKMWKMLCSKLATVCEFKEKKKKINCGILSRLPVVCFCACMIVFDLRPVAERLRPIEGCRVASMQSHSAAQYLG